MNVEEAIAKYVELRAKKAEIEAAVKEKTSKIREGLDLIEAFLIQKADETGVTSFKTDAGTAFLSHVNIANVADWDAVLEFVKTKEAYDLLERRVNKTAVKEYIDRDGAVPAGVNFTSRVSLNVRKASPKG